jgi:lysozyme family protein
VFIDGVEKSLTFTAGSNNGQWMSSGSATVFSANALREATVNTGINGSIDEVRYRTFTGLSSWTVAADWIKLEYYSTRKTNWNGDSWITWNSEL